MTKRALAKLMIKCYDFTTAAEFAELILFLKICLYHTEDSEQANDIQNAIYYVTDKAKMVD